MSSEHSPPDRPDEPTGVRRFVTGWMRALRYTSYVPIPWEERERILTGVADSLVELISTVPLDANAAEQIGRDLVARDFATPEALGRTLFVLSGLPEIVGLEEDEGWRRLVPLIEHLSTGFARAMYDRSLDGQEAVRIAALSAQSRAEQALKASEERFRRFATHDELTGLPNRTRFVERVRDVTEAASADQRLGVCCINLDGFNVVNDSLGHDIGDRLLVAAAKRLTRVGTTGSGVAFETFRLHSDEFALLLPDIDSSQDVDKAAHLALTALSEPFHIGENEVPLTASAGIVVAPALSGEPSELLRSTEIALHWAKNDGKGKALSYEPTRSSSDGAKFRLSAAMPSALRRNQFTLAYQPLVDMDSGSMIGVEALARWRHPELGMLLVGNFIGLAEDTGLIIALDDHLLMRACQQAARWQEQPNAPYVSVNLASRQLHRVGLVGYVAQVLEETSVDPSRIQLEITEHAVIDTDAQAIEALEGLTRLGVRIVIDDFGTGYSNLACLNRLPVHGLKLDAAFARHVDSTTHSDDRRVAFLTTIVQLGHVLGLDVIAEGIETQHQARVLRDAGCDTGQGWLFGRPADPRAIELMRGRRVLKGLPAARR
ncbi:putative bifunctional diguanylate cyclase/phosphodiesterase [Stackebrandtia soli]|uniref:putative bifunctional diguanylate cyclase/phosphodiesterase n=1 Tax=Stackebrandtia soli TaxID=1892856 RepID=UPI0039EAD6EF